MAMRDLVTGGAACAVPGNSSSNPVGALANVLIGSSSKTQERLKEIPNSIPTTSGSISESERQLSILPGSELDHESLPYVDTQTSEFLRGFHSADHGALADAWDDIHGSHDYNFHLLDRGVDTHLQPILEGPPQRILSSFLQSFISSSHQGVLFNPAPLPVLGLSDAEKLCIRDRSSIMARHLFADKSEDYINAQVNALLSSLDIDTGINSKQHIHNRFREMEEYWNDSNPVMKGSTYVDSPWVTEFKQHKLQYENPDTWAHSFQQQHGANGWASEFEQMQSSMTSANQANISTLAAMEQTRMLAHTLAQNDDPKFQKSKFLQFVSKMSRGELIIDDEQIKPSASTTPMDWASKYQKEYARPVTWGDEFAQQELTHASNRWATEFSNEQTLRSSTDEQWANEFSKLHINDWAEEFGRQVGEGALGDDSADKWADSYNAYLSEQIAAKQGSDSSKGVYVFSDMNPYVGHPAPLKEGQELFRKGLLSEAVLSLEAEVLKNPDNAEGWRLLGIAHAENDDDQQAIAAMMHAQEVEPKNLEVLLALGVSHTNELEQTAALKYLYGWLCNHPKYGTLAPPGLADSLYFADIAKAFSEAAQMSPDDADIHIVLGVLYNLSREYDKAIESFRMALKLKPHDYSLWNKLGATQANSIQSADAILAYQQALDLKPNYVRAWTNMGISYANQGMYQESIRYYVRALAMNPKAENAWQYLRISLSCASRSDMMSACDSHNLDLLHKEFPL